MTPAEFRAAFVRGLLSPLDPRTLLNPQRSGGPVKLRILSEARLDNDERRTRLLHVIREKGGEWPAGRVWRLYREEGWAPCRTTARKDLQLLAQQGFLVERGPENGRTYTLNHARSPR